MPVASFLAAASPIASSVIGGILGNNAAGAASQAAQQAAAQGNSILSGVQQQTTNNLQPFVNYGQQEGGALAGLLGVGGNPSASNAAFQNYLNSTNYQFQLGQGENAIKTANAPAFDSGATAKALNNYAQGQAGSALQGYEGLLTQGEGLGVGAGSALGQINTGNAAQQAQNLLSAAGVTANADIYGASSLTNALKGITSGLSSFGGGGGLSSLFGGSSGGGGGSSGALSGVLGGGAGYANPLSGISLLG